MDSANIAILMQSLTTLGVALIAYMGLRFKSTIEKLETNTNSIKDALVATTKEASFAKGILEQKRRTAEADATAPKKE